MRQRLVFWVLATAGLGGCINAPTYRRPPVQPVRAAEPAALRQCVAKLDRIVMRYALLPDRDFGGGCSALGSVQLRDIGTRVANLGAMTCPLAYAFTVWVQSDLQIPAMAEFGSPVVRVETFGTYSCRAIAGSQRLSEHATANAVDVAGFVLQDGRRIAVVSGWRGDGADGGGEGERAGRFLRSVRASACRRFNTVLSPDYNTAHRDHFHFDMGNGPLCR